MFIQTYKVIYITKLKLLRISEISHHVIIIKWNEYCRDWGVVWVFCCCLCLVGFLGGVFCWLFLQEMHYAFFETDLKTYSKLYSSEMLSRQGGQGALSVMCPKHTT